MGKPIVVNALTEVVVLMEGPSILGATKRKCGWCRRDSNAACFFDDGDKFQELFPLLLLLLLLLLLPPWPPEPTTNCARDDESPRDFSFVGLGLSVFDAAAFGFFGNFAAAAMTDIEEGYIPNAECEKP